MGRGAAAQVAALRRHKTFLDLTDDDLGVRLCKVATDGCLECIVGQVDPDGAPWPDLSADYAEWKARHYGGLPIGVKDFVMARPEEVAGEVEVASDRAVVIYGVSDRAREEAGFFQDGTVPRRFWGFTDSSRREARKLLKQRLKDKL